MKRITIRCRGTVVALVSVAALALAGGIAYATIPGPDRVYNACMLKSIGTIRLIDKSLPSTNLMSRYTRRLRSPGTRPASRVPRARRA